MLDPFLRSDLKWIKKHGLGVLPAGSKKIIVSTCYFVPDFIIDYQKNTFNYLTTFIENVELFKYKIDKIHEGQDIKDQYILRIYIDSVILDLNILKNIKTATKRNKNNNNLGSFIKKYEETEDAYNYIILCIKEYIKRILSSNDEKYKHIEFISYFNNDLTKHLISNPNTIVSGHFKTFGTLMRYHPITMPDTDVCIMRNLGDQITLLDLFIQKYWIDKKDQKYMEYYFYYAFEYYNPGNEIFVKAASIIYNIKDTGNILLSKSQETGLEDVSLGFIMLSRSLGGLISCKNLNTDSIIYTRLFKELEDKFFFNNEIQLKMDERFFYGIDEMIITYLFRDMREHNMGEINTLNTFGININNYTCSTYDDNHKIVNTYRNFKLKMLDILFKIFEDSIDNDKKLVKKIILEINRIFPSENHLKLLDKYYLPYNYIFSSKFLGDVNIADTNTSKLLFLLKSFDLNIKPYFRLKYFKNSDVIFNDSLGESIINLLKQISNLDDSNPLKFIKYLEIDITQGKPLQDVVLFFLDNYLPMFNRVNFKPIIIYPLCFTTDNLTMHDISNQFLSNEDYFKSEQFKIFSKDTYENFEQKIEKFYMNNNNNNLNGGYKMKKKKTHKKVLKKNKTHKKTK